MLVSSVTLSLQSKPTFALVSVPSYHQTLVMEKTARLATRDLTNEMSSASASSRIDLVVRAIPLHQLLEN